MELNEFLNFHELPPHTVLAEDGNGSFVVKVIGEWHRMPKLGTGWYRARYRGMWFTFQVYRGTYGRPTKCLNKHLVYIDCPSKQIAEYVASEIRGVLPRYPYPDSIEWDGDIGPLDMLRDWEPKEEKKELIALFSFDAYTGEQRLEATA